MLCRLRCGHAYPLFLFSFSSSLFFLLHAGVEPSADNFGTVELKQLTMTKELSVGQLVSRTAFGPSFAFEA